MKGKKKIIGAILVILGIVIIIILNLRARSGKALNVESEDIERKDLTSVVSASGQVKAKKTVNISANSIGTITKLGVKEGDYVKRDQFLLLIDPIPLQKQLDRLKASLKSAEAAYEIAKTNYEKAEKDAKRIEELYKKNLQSKEEYEHAMAALEVAKKELQSAKLRIEQERASMEAASHDLKKVTILSPIDGLVTRLNVEEGENVIMGTMNNPGTVIMTISDMSVVEIELEVDETDVVDVKIGQEAKVSLDAFPDKSFKGVVSEIGNSPLLTSTTSATTQAVNFKVVVLLKDKIEGVRPGFSATADIYTARRKNVIAVPIQALVSREMFVDEKGNVLHNEKGMRRNPDSKKYKKKELEGVFVIKDNRAIFVPVKVGIAGESYFEVLSGLKEKDKVITGPYKILRELKDGDQVKTKGYKRSF